MIQTITSDDPLKMAKLHATAFHPAWSEQDFTGYIANQHDLVLGWYPTQEPAPNQELSGFVICRCQADQAEILTLVVDPAKRRFGAGRQLMMAIEPLAIKKGVTVIFLEVAKDNPAALALYRSIGYVGVGIRKAYYRRPRGRMDAVILSKNIQS